MSDTLDTTSVTEVSPPATPVDTTTGSTSSSSPPISPDSDLISKSEVDNLMKALKAERESRKIFEKEARDKAAQLEKFAEVNPEEYKRLQGEISIIERERIAAEERATLLEEKHAAQVEQANKLTEKYQSELQDFRKRYALERAFFAAGGRTDSEGGISFFDLLADRLGGSFRLEPGGSITVIGEDGKPVLSPDSKKKVSPEEYLGSLKEHPIYGTFFKGTRGSGAGLAIGGTDSRGETAEGLDSLSTEELFEKAFI